MSQNLEEWMSKGQAGQQEFRKAVHTVLVAISLDEILSEALAIKGGILIDLAYESGRFTKDIDFSTECTLAEINEEQMEQRLSKALSRAVVTLPYQVDCLVQSIKTMPSPDKKPSFPSFLIKVGHATKGTAKHKKLLQKQSPSIIKIDLSLNEKLINIDQYAVSETGFIRSYAVNDLIAEKLRSLIQQVTRDRHRRQDTYDLNILINEEEVDKAKVLESLKEKSSSRNLDVTRKSLDEKEVKSRAKRDYHTLVDEIQGELPDFEESYQKVLGFYKALPW